jgi:ubiquinone/menaquinone biosynthesis C-methylase UbiE
MAGHDHAFTGLAESYRKARPTYPPEMAEALVAFAHPTLQPGAQVVDVGAGTGISTLALTRALPPGCAVIGIEPNDDMRAPARASLPAGANLTFSAGNAEKLPFDDGDVALVATGQAIQWFDRPKFYAEAARVLCPAGTLAIFENNRDWRNSALLDAHEDFLEAAPARPQSHDRSTMLGCTMTSNSPSLRVTVPLLNMWPISGRLERKGSASWRAAALTALPPSSIV